MMIEMTDPIKIERYERFPEEDRHYAEILEKGYTIIPNAIPDWLLDGLLQAIDEMRAKQGTSVSYDGGLDVVSGRSTFRTQSLLKKNDIFQKVYAFEPILSLAERMLGPEYLLSSSQTLCIGPGEKAQFIHTDDIYVDIARPHAPIICNTIWALSEFTEENGATRFVAGSHRNPELPRPTLAELMKNPPEVETEFAAMKPGSILILDGAIWHGGGANNTDTMRYGLAVSYCKGWMRQQDNFQLSMPPELVRRLDPKLKSLLGFGLYQSLLGNIDGQSPINALDL